MLVEPAYTEGDVVTLKLVSGEEILGIYDSETDSVLTLKKTRAIVQTHTGLGLAVWPATASEEVTISIKKAQIMLDFATDPEIAKTYHQSVTSIDLSAVNSGIIQ